MDIRKSEIDYKKLRPRIDLSQFEKESADLDIDDFSKLHERAVEALILSLSVEEDRYNAFVIGSTFAGRDEIVGKVVNQFAQKRPTPDDWIYVHNFDDPSSPIALSLPPGLGRQLVSDVDNFINTIRTAIRHTFENEEVVKEKEQIIKEFNRQKEKILSQLNEKARELGFIIQPQPAGFNIIPIYEGEPLTPQKYATLPPEIKEMIDRRRKQLEEHIAEALRKLALLDRELKEKLEEYDRELVRRIVEVHFKELRSKYEKFEEVAHYLDKMYQDILQNVSIFLIPPDRIPQGPLDPFRKYKVNLIVDNQDIEGAPVVFEKNPTYYNLMGRIEKEIVFGALMTDFNNIKAGSFHKANGGYLIIDAYQLLKDPFAYDALKRVLRTRQIFIEEIGERFSLFSTKTIRPQPIPFHGRVILVGDSLLYYLLYYLDPEFNELFRVKSEMETDVPVNEENLKFYYQFALAFGKRANLKPFTREALEEILVEMQRHIEDRKKLSTNIQVLKELMLEAHHVSSGRKVKGEDVRKAIELRRRRNGRVEERIREMIERGFILVSTQGSKQGVVNGLSVIQIGNHTFGVPSRITASIGLGKPDIVDIERETGLGGKIHSKAVMIMGGYIYDMYGKDFPITLHVRLTFEQNYSGVEGDSATVAELLAVLSEISGIPVKQSIAITGSMNQKGEVQPVGGVNHKIEGFYYTCKAMGLTGDQGVIIPKRNLDNLILNEEVVDAVKKGQFHIWAVETVDEAIEIATGRPAKDFHGEVKKKLKQYYQKSKRGGKSND